SIRCPATRPPHLVACPPLFRPRGSGGSSSSPARNRPASSRCWRCCAAHTDAAPVSRRFIFAPGFVCKPDRGLVIALFVLGLRDLEQASGVVRFRFNPFQTSPIKVGGERVIALFVMDGADVFQRLGRLSLLVQLFVNR